MTDKADHRVECHRLASELRAKGKNTWAYHVAINQHQPEEGASDEETIEAGKLVAGSLKASLPKEWCDEGHDDYDEDFDNIIWELEHIGWEGAVVEDHLRAAIEALYDWADMKRVWLK